MNALKIFSVFFIILLLAMVIFIYYIQAKILFYPSPLPKDFSYSFSFAFEELEIATKNATINAVYARKKQAKGLIVYFHGNAGNLSNWGSVAEDFLEYGYEVLIIDYRGFGKSSGKIGSEDELLYDAMKVYEKAREFMPEHKIILYGRSLGSGIAAFVAAHSQPKAIILETPYHSVGSLARYYYPLIPEFLLRYRLPTYEWLQQADAPIYIIHGSYDEIIPLENASRLSKTIDKKHDFLIVPGGRHNNLGEFPEYKQYLEKILN